MHTGSISFCDKVALNIKSQEVKKEILASVEDLCQVKIIQKHFDNLDKNSFLKLNNNPHLATLKTNGNPYLLLLTKYNFVNQCIFIDKKIQAGYFLPRMIIAKFEFDNSLFENTLIDGEMLKNNNNQWIYLINDIIVYQGQYLDKTNFLKRLNIIHDVLQTKFRTDKNDICSLQVKKYVKYNELRYLVEELLPSLPYTCRGIYFKPLYLKFKNILYNFDNSLVKSVTRVKYQSDGTFITKKATDDSVQTLSLKKIVSNTSLDNVENKNKNNSPINRTLYNYSPNNNDSSDSGSTIEGLENKYFLVEKTDLPDVFYLYDDSHRKKGIACIPYLKTSKYLFEIFSNINFNNKIKMECEYSVYFNKWIPIKALT